MIDWEWQRTQVQPEDVLDAAKTIQVNNRRITIDPISRSWGDPHGYVEWAAAALSRGGDDACDSAAVWAKRAVCQRMDDILSRNHLDEFLRQNYGKKTEYLRGLKVPGLDLLRDMILHPRNEIEHLYAAATEQQARHAYEVAELFLKATETDAAIPLIAALGWSVSSKHEACSRPGNEYSRHDFWLTRQSNPMLLIDGYSQPAEVLIIYPKDNSVSVCLRKSFKNAQIIELNGRLRQCLNSTSYDSRHFDRDLMKTMRDQLRL